MSVTVAAPESGRVIHLNGIVQADGNDRLSRFVEGAGLFELYRASGDGLLSVPPDPLPTTRVAAVTLTVTGGGTAGYWIYANNNEPLVQIVREYGVRNTWFQADHRLVKVMSEMGIDASPAPTLNGWLSPWLILTLAGLGVGVLVGSRLRPPSKGATICIGPGGHTDVGPHLAFLT